MRMLNRISWKFVSVSVGFHLLIGGLLFCFLLNPPPTRPAVSVVQVRLADPIENRPAKAKTLQPLEGRPVLPTVVPVRPESSVPGEPATPDGSHMENQATVSETVPVPIVKTPPEEQRPISSGSSLIENAQARIEPTAEGGLRSDELSRFLQDVQNRLEEAKRYPWLARVEGQEGTVRVQFMIDPAGKAQDIRLLESSRSSILDEEAVETVRRVGRFSHWPVSWNKKIQVQVPLVFQLNQP